MPTSVLLDTGVISHSEFAEFTAKELPVRWAGRSSVSKIYGLKRKPPARDEDYQKQMEAMFTVGRMIREGKIAAYTYVELEFERFRGRVEVQEFNALRGYTIHKCDPAIRRSQFVGTTDFQAFIAKGGRKDRRSGAPLGEENQTTFLKWLYGLDKELVDALVDHASVIGLNQFEIDSLRDLEWFQLVCKRSRSPENYPDVFHLWTAERNRLDTFLTLEKKLPNLVDQVRNEKRCGISVSTQVLRPLALLEKLGVAGPDPVPIEIDRFYNLYQH
jgi:hypothetical protein